MSRYLLTPSTQTEGNFIMNTTSDKIANICLLGSLQGSTYPLGIQFSMSTFNQCQVPSH